MCCVALASVLLLTACGGGQSKAKGESKDTKASEKVEVSKPTEGLSSMFPLKEKVTLTYFISENSSMAATMKSYNEVEFFKELEKKTNVHIEFNHNESDNALALMIAGGDLPDMINAKFGMLPGGVPSLLEDDIIADLSTIIPKYAPNYYDWLQKNPDENKAFKLDDGTMYQFVGFNGNWEDQKVVNFLIKGSQIRQDWLDKVGMSMPTTTDELYQVLKAFKEQDVNGNGDPNDEIPFVVSKDTFNSLYTLAGSFGTRKDFQMLDGKVAYGPITNNFKNFLTYIHKLYDEGLINSDFAQNESAFDLILQSKAGFTNGSMGSSLIAAHEALKQKDPNANFVSVPWLKDSDGNQSGVDDINGNVKGTAITTACKNPDIAAAWLDYAYSQEGSLNSTFGVEGKSYQMIDGYPTIMDEVRTNDKGWSEEQSISRWMLGPITYPNARDDRFFEQMNLNEQYKKDIQTNWGEQTDAILLPPLTLTSEESDIYGGIMPDLQTYMDECVLKFITGKMSIDSDWDDYVNGIKGMGIDEAIKCKQTALERYEKR